MMDDHLARRILAELAEIKARLALAPLDAPPNRSLSRREAAAYLGVHAKTLATMTTDSTKPGIDQVTGYRAKGRWKYRQTDLDAYRDRHLVRPTGRAKTENIDWGA